MLSHANYKLYFLNGLIFVILLSRKSNLFKFTASKNYNPSILAMPLSYR